jgi:tRNA-(ms[2]io[6]A)-hydroxylase
VTDLRPVLDFLPCRTPAAWAACAVDDLDTLLLDHASLELKAAEQAQKIIRKYGRGESRRPPAPIDGFRHELASRMSRLAREELRHFERVLAVLESRGQVYRKLPASRYAACLHDGARRDEPGALIDTLVIGAIIEARSCERFLSLLPALQDSEPAIARFYESLLRSEARHFEDYLALARRVDAADTGARTALLLGRDAELIGSPDAVVRFLGGTPVSRGGLRLDESRRFECEVE